MQNIFRHKDMSVFYSIHVFVFFYDYLCFKSYLNKPVHVMSLTIGRGFLNFINIQTTSNMWLFQERNKILSNK